MESMASLEAETKELNFHLEQVEYFTPPPMTMATEMYYTGINPETGDKIFCAKNMREKEEQRLFFFWYKKEEQARIRALLKKMGRQDILRSCLNFIGK